MLIKLIPNDTKWDPNATPPEFTNGEDMHIRVGTHVRVKLLGTRAEVGELWAIGSIKEDYLGYVLLCCVFVVCNPYLSEYPVDMYTTRPLE